MEEVDGVLDFYYYRKPQENPKVDMKQKISILWRPELAHIQELNGMHKYTDKSKRFVTERILATLPEPTKGQNRQAKLFGLLGSLVIFGTLIAFGLIQFHDVLVSFHRV
nr:hypothetical protein [Lachnospiraceae bacterium]